LRQIDGAGNLSAWLYRVTVNVCRDMLRRRKNIDSLDDSRLSVESSAESDLVEDQQRRMVVPSSRSQALFLAFKPHPGGSIGLFSGSGYSGIRLRSSGWSKSFIRWSPPLRSGFSITPAPGASRLPCWIFRCCLKPAAIAGVIMSSWCRHLPWCSASGCCGAPA